MRLLYEQLVSSQTTTWADWLIGWTFDEVKRRKQKKERKKDPVIDREIL